MTRTAIFLAWMVVLLCEAGAATSFAQAPAAAPVTSPSTPPATDPTPARRDEALAHFELGLTHFDRAEWSAALAEFLRARDLYPTRAATKNAALCMQHENRFDEALDMFESLLRDYPDLSGADRTLADAEIAELKQSVGTLDVSGAEPGSSVVVDGKARGLFPLVAPLRVSVGAHVVRVFKEGFEPFEQRIDIASGRTASVQAHLTALARSGRLRVVEQTGKALDVVVDGALVGKTPWGGSVAPGTHSILLRGEGDVGTQPVTAPVSVDAETPVTLTAEDLDAVARIEPTPGAALVAIDRVSVGRGVWEGRLRSGHHRVEVTAEGFVPTSVDVTIPPRGRERVGVSLDRDPTSPLWGRRARPHFTLEIDAALALTPTLGGGVSQACTAPCSASVPLGGIGLVRASYELPDGLGFGIEGGYLGVRQALDHRPSQIIGSALRVPADYGTVSDTLSLSGLLVGGSLLYHRGEVWTFTARVGVGAYLSNAVDARNGTFTTSANAAYSVGVSESHGASFLYAAPEVRLGRRIGGHLELSVGLQVLVLAALNQPAWTTDDTQQVHAGPPNSQGDGLGMFSTQTLTGPVLVLVAPGVGARYDF